MKILNLLFTSILVTGLNGCYVGVSNYEKVENERPSIYSNHVQNNKTTKEDLKKIMEKESTYISYNICLQEKCTTDNVYANPKVERKWDENDLVIEVKNKKVSINLKHEGKDYLIYEKDVSFMDKQSATSYNNGIVFTYEIIQN